MAAYVKVANAADLQPGQALLVNAGDRRVASDNGPYGTREKASDAAYRPRRELGSRNSSASFPRPDHLGPELDGGRGGVTESRSY